MSNIDELIGTGESDIIELKSSLHHQYGPLPPGLQNKVEKGLLLPSQAQKEVQRELRKEITKTIAAFLNTAGGTLLIGVDEPDTVLGIEPDFRYLQQGKQDVDGWLLSLQQVIINALSADVWSAVRVSLVHHGEETVAVVNCPARTSETWHREEYGGERFCMRASNGTRELNGSALLRYIRERWPA